MKIERSGRTTATRRVAAAGYARAAENVTPLRAPDSVVASIFGIPDAEFTPSVQGAVMKLMGEAETLRSELQQTRLRLEQVEQAADRDQLLPILNRRAFVRELSRHIAFATRYSTPSSLIYFDLDSFKSINDTYGHAAGDAALTHFADTLLAHVRESDVVGRLGGDEFGIILTHTDRQQAHSKATSLAKTLKASPALWRGRSIQVGFSYGAFELEAGENADNAMQRADEAMYAHKRAAR
ncbi:MAG TPA: GGDEF domain-containing protein [Rhizomicrobium sp.]|jgi:diguanylate cyclase (GGDEF)-like protein